MSGILFSPLGITDPISNFRDGAMLHICRNYEIDKVYLYMSNEVYGYHKHDNRYLYCLEKLSEQLDRKIEYELIIREELEDVHLFDFFLDEYSSLLEEIHTKNPDDEIYLNVSSGTPAMKSALQTLAVMSEINMIPIQTSTPVKKSNPHSEEKKDYRPEEQWECNEDNTDPQNRCEISSNINFSVRLRKKMIEELIRKYDYVGAKAIADTMQLDEKFTDLMNGAYDRYMLRFASANAAFKKYGITLGENEHTNYLRNLDLKVKKEEYADFIRAITPLIVDLFEMVLAEDVCGNFRLSDYTKKNQEGIVKWDRKILGEKAPDVLAALNANFQGNFKGGNVYAAHLVIIIDKLSSDSRLAEICNKLRTIEEQVRNIGAHEIVSINDKWIHNRTSGYHAADIVDMLCELMKYTQIKIDKNFLASYDTMNDILIECL